jgi:hypothetical protein
MLHSSKLDEEFHKPLSKFARSDHMAKFGRLLWFANHEKPVRKRTHSPGSEHAPEPAQKRAQKTTKNTEEATQTYSEICHRPSTEI